MKDIEQIQGNIADYIDDYVDYINKKGIAFHQKDEGYKFKAVATFQKEFNLKAKDWTSMIESSLKDTLNLVASGNYFPKPMLLSCIKEDKNFVRKEFEKLLMGKEDVPRRIDNFIDNFETKFSPHGKYKQLYFDYRFVSFFLASFKPSKYFYVKYSDYKKFAEQVEYDLNLSRKSPGEHYREFAEMAEKTREVLSADKSFMDIHSKIVSAFDFKDDDLSWGTYDFIFNVSRERWKEKRIQQKKREKIIADFKEYYKDVVEDEDKIENQIVGKSTQELFEEGERFKPPTESYIRKEGSYKVRLDSVKQKKIVKDINDYKCQICGFSFIYKDAKGKDKKYAQADHIVGKEDGGTEELSNLWVLCPNCHAQKTLGVIIVDKKQKIVKKNNQIIKINLGHLKKYGWGE